ncbi:MAG: hypothetical protein CM1200mP16_15730 [Nitrospina sp.]|nr:MAG: hypothetical protein CM1200mP16_15730 [Nitrospina sp.]
MLPGSNDLLQTYEFKKITPQTALAVFFSEQEYCKIKSSNKRRFNQDQLTSISNYLNDEFSGKPI